MGMQQGRTPPTPWFTKEVQRLLPYEAWDLRKEVPVKKPGRKRKPPEDWEFTEDNKEGE
jgi:hypothetical protein